MAKAILARTLADDATISAGSAAANMPVSNLLARQPSKKWRATALGSAYVVLDLGTATEINFAALLYANLTGSATMRVRAASSEAGLTSAPGYDSTANTFWPNTGLGDWDYVHGFVDLVDDPQTFRWWRIDLSDGSNPDGYIQAGRLMLGGAFRFARNFQYPLGVQWIPAKDAAGRTRGGAFHAEESDLFRRMTFDLKGWPDADMLDDVFDLQRRQGIARDVLFVHDPAASARVMQRMIYGTFQKLDAFTNDFVTRWGVPITLDEMR